jgi:hypothetical protein
MIKYVSVRSVSFSTLGSAEGIKSSNPPDPQQYEANMKTVGSATVLGKQENRLIIQ